MLLDIDPVRYTAPFCDYVTVTLPIDSPLLPEVEQALLGYGFYLSPRPSRYGGSEYRSGARGSVVLKPDKGTGVCMVGASGGALAYLRDEGQYLPFLSLLGSVPHRVTRVDAAMDVATDPSAYLEALTAPNVAVMLAGKASPRRQFIGEHGYTVYFGGRHARVSARVYDKSAEAWDKRRESIPPTLRVELTVLRDMRPSLRDAAAPSALFWHFAKALLAIPDPAPAPWVPIDGDDVWIPIPGPKPSAYMAAAKALELLPLDGLRHKVQALTPEERRYLALRLLKAAGLSDEGQASAVA
jgi:hypothetical protein